MPKKHSSPKALSSSKASLHRHQASQQPNRGRWIGLIVGVVVILTAAYLLLHQNNALPTEVQVTQAHDMYQKGAFFLDVRTQAEWDQGHIERSNLVPLDELQGRMSEVPRDQDIVVVCRSGARSKEGAAILRQAGFKRVTCMNGGIQAWVTAGYPVIN